MNRSLRGPRHMSPEFQSFLDDGARLFRAPGRVNLIGEHTDYNDGFVMPAAIGFSTWVAVGLRDDRKLSIFSESFSDRVEFDLDDHDQQSKSHWSNYVTGVALALEQAGHYLRGASVRITSEVPMGSGLSSSAALEVATAYALLANSGHNIDRTCLARLCQRAENEFVGARCGIMDQFVSSHGEAGKALLLDCRSLEYRLLPLPDTARLVICNTMVKHELARGAYNERRAECAAGVQRLARVLPGVSALRDVIESDLELNGNKLPEVIYRRCRHVISENARVLEAASALELSDLGRFGQLMNESHRSLRDDYEVSCAELDLMVELAHQAQGAYGARMTGGGFGGCTINLVKSESVEEFKRTVAEGYEKATGLAPEIYVCSAVDGAGEA